MTKNNENNNYVIPVELHKTSLRKVIDFINKTPLSLELTINNYLYINFILTGYKTGISIKARRYKLIDDSIEQYEGILPIKLSTQIEYVCISKKCLLYYGT